MNDFNTFALITGLISGLALFLYGMDVMSAALTQNAGGSLEKTLVKLTSNRWIAYLSGVLITSVIQSSSATTVMIVGLVNAGLTTLAEAVNLILGANLGTTITAWILSLNSISGSGFFLNLLKPANFTPFLAIIGVALNMFTHSEKKKSVGAVMIGFSILIFGMNMMSDAVEPLKDVPEFTDLLTSFSNPFLGFLVGLGFTLVIQSSSASIGVLQAIAASVYMTMGTAIPVIVGCEVGTTITAILSSLGAGRNGKRAAAMHASFNVIKSAIFMTVFYTINAIHPFAFLEEQATMAAIAVFHTCMALIFTLITVPVSEYLVKIAYRILPVTDAERDEEAPSGLIRSLDERFLDNPTFAVQQARLAAADMARMTQDCLNGAVSLLDEYTEEKAAGVLKLEGRIDNYEDQIGTYLVKINSHHLEPKDSHEVSILQHCVNDFERMSDHARNVAETFTEMNSKDRHFSGKAVSELKVMTDAVKEITDMAVKIFIGNDMALARKVEPLEERIDGLRDEIKERHMARLHKGKCSIDVGFNLSDLEMDLERIADHCSNVAVCVLQVNENVFDTHEYIENMLEEDSKEFNEQLAVYENKFRLPAKKGSDSAEETDEEESLKKSKSKKERKKAEKKDEKKVEKKDEKRDEKKDRKK